MVLNTELDKEINSFFETANNNVNSVLNELKENYQPLEKDEIDLFLEKKNEFQVYSENFLISKYFILEKTEIENEENLCSLIKGIIKNLDEKEEALKSELNSLFNKKVELNQLISSQSIILNEKLSKKKEIDEICKNVIKEEFIKLCKYLKLKFQHSNEDKKFTIIFLSDKNQDVNQVSHIDPDKLLRNEEDYLKKLKEQFKQKVLHFLNV